MRPIKVKTPRAITKKADHETKIIVCGFRCPQKKTDVAIANGRSNGKVRSYGKIDSTLDALNKLNREVLRGVLYIILIGSSGIVAMITSDIGGSDIGVRMMKFSWEAFDVGVRMMIISGLLYAIIEIIFSIDAFRMAMNINRSLIENERVQTDFGPKEH